MIAEIVAKAAETAREVAAVQEIDLASVVTDAENIANEIWPASGETLSPIKAKDTPESIADEAWNKDFAVEETYGKGTLDNPRYVITRNEFLANDIHPITGVEFIRKTVQLSEEVIEGVFPKFEFVFETKLPDHLLLETDKNQFRECNRRLVSDLEANPELKSQFTPEQIEQIYDGVEDGTAPDGYVWHHNEEVGIMQLVDAETHARTGHTGGKSIWGGGKEFR